MEVKKTPAIRFREYSEGWETQELDEYIVPFTETTTKNNQYPPLTSSRKGIFLQTEYFAGHQIASADNTGYNIVPYGYFTYRHMSDDEIFHFNINDIIENGIVSTLYPVFTTSERLHSRYLQYQLNDGREFARFAFLQKQGGSRTYMYLNKLKQLNFTFPVNTAEQKKIADLLLTIDDILSTQQSRYDKLLDFKKSMLEKMFPQAGAKVPEVRFTGFSGDWELKKFNELYVPITQKNDLSFGTKQIISVANMYYNANASVTDIDYLRTYNVFLLGDIAFEGHQSKEFRYGRFVENDIGNGIVSHIFTVFRPKCEYDLSYWKYAINNEKLMRPILSCCTKASTMMNDLVAKDFLDSCIRVPTIDEQRKIGAFLKSLDELVSLYDAELEKLKNIKSALLEKMFV